MPMSGNTTWIFAAAITSLASLPASAATLTYDLKGTLASSTGGPDLTADGGTLRGYGYSFGPNQGLVLPAIGGADFSSYSISIDFSFTPAPPSRGNGYRKILDFSGLASDAGLYTLGNTISLYPNRTGGVFNDDTPTSLMISRSATGLVDVTLGGNSVISYDDAVTKTFAFTNAAPLHFFEDDAVTGHGEAGTGFVSSIVISTDAGLSAVPLPPALPMFAASLLTLFGVVRSWTRKATRTDPASA